MAKRRSLLGDAKAALRDAKADLAATRRALEKEGRKLAKLSNAQIYARRIARYQAKHPGAPKQAARGKRPREHVERKAREIQKYHGMTKPQQAAVEQFGREQAKRSGKDTDTTIRQFENIVRERGYAQFARFRATIKRLGTQKRQRLSRALRRKGAVDLAPIIAGRDRAIAAMYELLEDFGFDPDDFDLTYYHD